MMIRLLGIGILIAFACSFASPALGAHWPGWRGDGGGVSPETDLPTEWGPDQNVRWKKRIEGDGISSPIVWGDRVFVSTAVEGEESVLSRTTLNALLGGLLVLAFATFAPGLRRRKDRSVPAAVSPGWLRMAVFLDRTPARVALLLFAAGMVLWIVAPGALIEPGDEARAWRASGVLGMLGLLAASGRWAMRSWWRLIAAGIFLIAAVLYHAKTPFDLFNRPIPFLKLLVASGPLVVAAVWCVLMFLVTRRAHTGQGERAESPAMRAVGSAALVASVAIFFAFVNYLQPRAGLLRSIVCLERDSGDILWQSSGFLAAPSRKYRVNSYATPTPVTDGKHVAANFGPGAVCMDYEGRVKWRILEPNYARFVRYGAASGPVMFEDKVIYAFMAEMPGGKLGDAEHARHSYLRAVNTETGQVVWEVRPPGAHDSYDTPALVRSGGKDMLLFTSWEYVVAYDPQSGEELWRCKLPIEQAVPTIVSDGETAYVAGGTHGPKAVVAIRLDGRGDVTDTHVVWTVTRRVPECSSPVLVDGLLYWITEKGIITCLDAKSGEEVWKHRIDGHYIGSPVAGDGKIYFPSDDGVTTVIEAARAFKMLASNATGEESAASPALSAGHIFIRGKEHLFASATHTSGTEPE